MIQASSFRILLVCLTAAGLVGCASNGRPVPPRSAVTSSERGYYKIGQPYTVDGVVYTPAEDWNYDETGIASWYGPDFHGKRTANGELYNMNEVTGAHKTLPMPCLVRVTNLDNGRSIIVRVNDRGPFARGRILDLSRRSAQLLGFEKVGTAKVHVQIMARESQALADAARAGVLAVNLPGIDPNAPPPAAPRTAPPSAPVYAKAPPVTQQPLPPPVAVATVDEQHVIQQDFPEAPIKGKSVGGRFLPAPQVTLQKVRPSTIYIQAGAFSVMENAERMRAQLNRVTKTDISPTMINGRAFYRVRIGPIASVDDADQLLARVVAGGAGDAKIIVD